MEKPRIQDDLYLHVNQEWIENAVIPDDKPTAGGFADLATGIEKLLGDEFAAMSKGTEFPSAHLENACKLYKSIVNVSKRKRDGVKPLLKALKIFDKMVDFKFVNRKLSDLILDSFPLPFDVSVNPNQKDTSHHALYVGGAGTFLPDTTYYKEAMAQQKAMMIGLFTNMVKGVLAQVGLSQVDIELYVKDALAFDEKIAKFAKSSEEWSDYPAMYNPMKTGRVCSFVKPFKLKKALSKLFPTLPEQIIVTEPRYFKAFKEICNEENFNEYKHWAFVKVCLGSTGVLTEELRELGGTFQRALMGIAKPQDVNKYAYNLIGAYYSEPIGLYYGKKYFGEEAKKDVVEMVKEIIETYKARIKRNTFLSDATKEKAILKLSTMRVKMGYPDNCDKIYDKLVYDEKLSLFANVRAFRRILTEDSYSKLYEEVNRDKWPMPGHMVNACYNPFTNDITFPAAILQAPFYSIKQTRSQNLGGIGAVIGHEISHAFDNNGAKCDEKGNLNNWWTKEDFKNFNKKTQAMIKEFEGIELPWGKVNAKFIVSENIADNGGMGCTLEIMSKMKDANYEEYFINWAKVWCLKAKPEYLTLLLNVDVHAPTVLRANMQPRNFEEWYTTFNVKKSDKMYIAPNKRVVIW